jgi:small subunit ribosomal protein S1
MRLDIGVNAVAHSCNMTTLPSKGDKIGLVVTRINDKYEVAEGIITRLIKRCV